jgi:uncharacterized protein
MRSVRLLLTSLCLAGVVWQAPLIAAFPSHQGFVNDFAGVLDEPSRAEIESLLRETERATSAEVVLVTVRSLDGMTVEDYAVRLFEAWKIGKKATDNGVLILVSTSDRAMRIEVGYGLEPILPDGLAGEIIRGEFLPPFRKGDYPRGIRQGIARVLEVVRKGEVAPAVQPSDDRPPLWFIIPFLGAFLGLGSFAIGIGLRSKTYAPLVFGALFALVPIIFVLVLRSGPATIILGSLAVGMVTFGYSKGGSSYWKETLRRRPSSEVDSSDGWMMGATSSSGSSSDGGSSSGGGDFGGGSSGGGGASGHW